MKLTDKYISNLKHLDKDQFFSQEGVEGLTLRIYKYPSTASKLGGIFGMKVPHEGPKDGIV